MTLDLGLIPQWQIYLVVLLRLVGLALLLISWIKVYLEFKNGKGIRATRLLLLILVSTLVVGSLIPFGQGLCYIIPRCFSSGQILPITIITAVNNLLSGSVLAIIYYTKERD